ncbi:MAG: putative tellurite resistance protein B-like protein [Bradymonadia bacterium]|jgi:uncharacterized tellurite resistance protein B-like protein
MAEEYAVELMKLLWRLAAADGEVAPVEQAFIEARAHADGVPEALIRHISAEAVAGRETDPPRMSVIAQRVEETRAAAQALVAVDGVLDDDEIVALRGLEAVLSAFAE